MGSGTAAAGGDQFGEYRIQRTGVSVVWRASRCVACPVMIDIHISYLSLGDNRRRAFLPDTGEADIINSLQVGQTHPSLAGCFERNRPA